MKTVMRHLFVAILLVGLSSVAAFAKTRTTYVNFSQDVTIAGTLVKGGEYKVKFNEETKELSLMKGNKVIVTTTGTLEARTDKEHSTTYQTKDNQLESIAFGGGRDMVVLGSTSQNTGSEF